MSKTKPLVSRYYQVIKNSLNSHPILSGSVYAEYLEERLSCKSDQFAYTKTKKQALAEFEAWADAEEKMLRYKLEFLQEQRENARRFCLGKKWR